MRMSHGRIGTGNRLRAVLLLSLLLCICVSCAGKKNSAVTSALERTGEKSGYRDNTPVILTPSADGEVVYSNSEVDIDASNLSEGYIMVKYTGTADKIRMLLSTPGGETYNYLVPADGSYAVYPMSEGSGTYRIGVYENILEDKYAELFTQEIEVTLTDEQKVFLYPNRYVDFTEDSESVKKGAELAADAVTELEVVERVYRYVTENISYDYEKAETVQSGYLPVVDETLQTKTGICFDYASLMAAMLRSQRIPTRLEIGYAGTLYHAWIGVYIEEQGWIDNLIVFDGKDWVLMDPTLASYAKEKTVEKQMKNADTYYKLKYKY